MGSVSCKKLSHDRIKNFPNCVPLLSFSNAILIPESSEQVTLEGLQSFSVIGEVIKNGGYVGVVQSLQCLEDTDFFTTGTLAQLTLTDMTKTSITFNLLGLTRFDIQEFIKTPHNFYAAQVCYKRYPSDALTKKMDRESLLHTFQKLLSYLECNDFDMELFREHSNERLLKELIQVCPLGHIAKQHILEATALEQQSDLLRQYMEETMLGPLVAFTRH
jgi:Lon protease-like protein